jgi:hypothetical protein
MTCSGVPGIHNNGEKNVDKNQSKSHSDDVPEASIEPLDRGADLAWTITKVSEKEHIVEHDNFHKVEFFVASVNRKYNARKKEN